MEGAAQLQTQGPPTAAPGPLATLGASLSHFFPKLGAGFIRRNEGSILYLDFPSHSLLQMT